MGLGYNLNEPGIHSESNTIETSTTIEDAVTQILKA